MTPHLLTLAPLLTVATAAVLPPPNPLPERATPIPPFEITNFAAGAVILSNRNYITFNVTLSPGADPIHCQAIGTTATEALGSIEQTWCNTATPSSPPTSEDDTQDEEQEQVWFTWTMRQPQAQPPSSDNEKDKDDGESRAGSAGADLRIVHQVGSHARDEAVHYIAGHDTAVVGEGFLAHQVYRGAENFSVAAMRYEAFEQSGSEY